MRKVKVLLVALLLLWGCAGLKGLKHFTLNKDYRARDVVMFPEHSKEKVWQACIDSLVDKYHCRITLSDVGAGLIQARQVTPGLVDAVVYSWTIQVLESGDGVNLRVHLERSVEYSGAGASDNVTVFIYSVRERLKEG